MRTAKIITKDTRGQIKHTRTIETESKQELQQEVEKWVRLGLAYTPEIIESPEGTLTLTWTERR